MNNSGVSRSTTQRDIPECCVSAEMRQLVSVPTRLFGELHLETSLHFRARDALGLMPEQPFMPERIAQATLTLAAQIISKQ